jgi:hypothetical protein
MPISLAALAIAILIVLVILYLIPALQPGTAISHPGSEGEQSSSCTDGQRRYCSAGDCSGVSVCVGGMWGGCRWDQVCTPGSAVPCISGSCPQGVKECNSCGTGYGPCG